MNSTELVAQGYAESSEARPRVHREHETTRYLGPHTHTMGGDWEDVHERIDKNIGDSLQVDFGPESSGEYRIQRRRFPDA